jgi:hypothetical protein
LTKKHRKGSRSGRSTTSTPTTSELAIAYLGPIKPPMKSTSLVTRLVNSTGVIASSASGVITQGFTNNPSASPDFAVLAGVYTEYRVLGTRFKWIPYFTTYSTATTPPLATQLALSCSRDPGASIPATVSQAIQNQPYVVGPIMKEMSLEIRMRGVPDADFVNCRTPTQTWITYIVSSSLSPSVPYGNYVVEFLIQFRNPL